MSLFFFVSLCAQTLLLCITSVRLAGPLPPVKHDHCAAFVQSTNADLLSASSFKSWSNCSTGADISVSLCACGGVLLPCKKYFCIKIYFLFLFFSQCAHVFLFWAVVNTTAKHIILQNYSTAMRMHSRSRNAMSSNPFFSAAASAVSCAWFCSDGSAPCSSNRHTRSMLPSWHASINNVLPLGSAWSISCRFWGLLNIRRANSYFSMILLSGYDAAWYCTVGQKIEAPRLRLCGWYINVVVFFVFV